LGQRNLCNLRFVWYFTKENEIALSSFFRVKINLDFPSVCTIQNKGLFFMVFHFLGLIPKTQDVGDYFALTPPFL